MSNRTSFGITSFVQSVVAGTAQAAVRLGADSAIRSISGLSREGNNSDLASRFNLGGGGKYGTALLAYPFDVETDQSQGHHIMFTIRIPDAAKIKQRYTSIQPPCLAGARIMLWSAHNNPQWPF